jgi:hypothetical protein
MRTFLTCVFWLTMVTLAWPSAVIAQENAVVADVPFDFIAGDRTLPAGTYRVAVLPEEGQPREPAIISLQTATGAEHPDQLVFQSVASRTVDVGHADWMQEAELVFSKVGSLYFLEEVRTP